MSKTDLILLHAPSIYDFRRKPAMYGPISDVVPSTQIFEMYPVGFVSMQEYAERHGYSVRIINVALRMLRSRRFNVEKLIRSLNPSSFGIDLHWMVHAQGSLELARIVKKYHPDTPVIFGGLSSSYYHRELVLYPQVDYVVRGDSAEEPLLQLLRVIKEKSSPGDVPNLTWKKNGKIQINEFSHIPADLDQMTFDYTTMISSTARRLDLLGHLPFKGWLNYPIVAALYCRGCVNNCVVCGGSASAFQNICARKVPAYRSPDLVARDIGLISHYFTAPVMIIGDLMQAGFEYARDLLNKIKKLNIRNHLAFELFAPPPKAFWEILTEAAPNFNIQISPESHDEKIRRAFGKKYDNDCLEETIKDAIESGCKRVDVFFMIGLPYQTPESVKETISYCGYLMESYGSDGKLQPYISPLAPFLDPGSKAFENPDKYGYRIFHRTLEEHRRALLSPSWKYILNYETKWMSRDDLVACTYESAAGLNRLKLKHGILDEREARKIEKRIERERQMINEIDTVLLFEDNHHYEEKIRRIIKGYNFMEHTTICKKDEMKWPMKIIRFHVLRIIRKILAGAIRSG